MRPTPRGSGVWVGHGKTPEPVATEPISETPRDGRYYCRRSVSSAEQTRLSHWHRDHYVRKIKDENRCFPKTPAGAYAPPTIMSPIAGLFAPAISRRSWPFLPPPYHTPPPRGVGRMIVPRAPGRDRGCRAMPRPSIGLPP